MFFIEDHKEVERRLDESMNELFIYVDELIRHSDLCFDRVESEGEINNELH